MRTGVAARLARFGDQYWERGLPGRDTPAGLAVGLYRLWLAAFAFKLLGSTWDVSWHFRWLRDDLAPPHLVNTVGTVIAIALVLFHTYTGYGADRTTLRLMQWGMGVFVLAAPLDVINHRVNGLDLTAWSPSHALLYVGTGIMIAGVIRGWVLHHPRGGRAYPLGLLVLWCLFLEGVWFAEQQQEYGVLELASWERGQPYAEPILLQFAADQIGRPVDRAAVTHFAMPIPDWVYLGWAVAAAGLVLVLARRMTGLRWAATAVISGYVAYRCLVWPLLVGAAFPPSVVPLFAVLLGVAVDVAFLLRLPAPVTALVGALLVSAAGYGGFWVQSQLLGGPPVDYRWLPAAFALLAVLWLVADRVVARRGWAALRPARPEAPQPGPAATAA
ncbi:hypothetical protein [Goodfellowiella coeruleoviolacea]|uniref:Uncharacterized protein n=1 Tax=Goodfellowiella coeruleoviolacea TaxID=334858 RepID=A0AAE3KH80_9PSEU|nr:hypothetical protein [Goodfellowiella coeruleoviolacea]MCP2166189.1 hypothetical protein [Goodfellowiella coeruleoviolacea]